MLAHVRHLLRVLISIPIFTMWLTACSAGGGGGGGSGAGGGMPAPNALSYPTPPAFVVNLAIMPLTPTVTGAVTSYTVSPSLPAGLALSASTGVISGTPTAVAAKASYTVTAKNAGGSTTTSLSIMVNGVAPAVAYAVPYIAYTVGVNAQPITPTTSGGAVVTWSVSPALPPGLALSQADGSISGQPSVAATATNYTVTATNSGGQSAANLTVAVAAAPLLDLGLVSSVTLMRYVNSSVLSQDDTGQWLLQSFASGATLASGNAGGATLANGAAPYVDLESNVMIDQTAAGLDIRSATDGHVLASIPAPTGVSWYRLAADGSYVAAGSPTALMAWSTSGQELFSKGGDYSLAAPFAAPGQIEVALGPAGQSVIETVPVMTGNSTFTPAFQGTFNSWFIDGQRFLTNTGNAVWTYSNTGVKQDLTSVTTTTDLTGQGNWFWTLADSGTLNVYQVGASGSPALTTAFGILTTAVPSGSTIGVLAYGVGQLTVIDLSGAAPVSTTYSLPYASLSDYAALSATQWLVGNDHGVVFDGTSLGGKPRALTLGTAWSIAGGTGFVSVATASGSILYFNAGNNTLAGTIDFSSSTLSASTNGTVLAAVANSNDAQYEPDRTLNIYSLPSGGLLDTYPYSYPNSDLYRMAMSGSATAIAEIFYPTPTGVCGAQVVPTSGGAPIFCDNTLVLDPSAIPDLQLSPDGTLLATSTELTDVNGTTNIYKNGTLVTAVPGQAAGWLDNTRLLVNEFANAGMAGLQDSGTTIYDSLGNKLGTTPILNIGPFQIVNAESVYLPSYAGFSTLRNVIVSLTTGAPTWASANSTQGIGAVSGSQVVFASGNLILAQPF